MIIASIQKDVMAGTLPLEVRIEKDLIVLQRRNIVVATNQTFDQFRAYVRDVAASDIRVASFVVNDEPLILVSGATLDALLEAL